jgi:hypothetical protein
MGEIYFLKITLKILFLFSTANWCRFNIASLISWLFNNCFWSDSATKNLETNAKCVSRLFLPCLSLNKNNDGELGRQSDDNQIP